MLASDGETMERTIIIGDVHGCLDELRQLLTVCGWRPGERCVLAGDLVAKGPNSAGVLQLAHEIGAGGVLGNHDDHVLRVRRVRLGLAAPPARGLRREHEEVADRLHAREWAYLESLPLYLRLGPEAVGGSGTVVVHAGAVPGIPLEAQSRDNLITMRSVRADGTPSKKIEERPWASVWVGPERIVFGHDAVRGLQQYPFATGLDTGCVYGHRLTALALPERRLFSVGARRAYAEL